MSPPYQFPRHTGRVMRKQNTFTFLAVMLVAVLLSASSAAPQTQTAAQKIAADRAAGLRQQLADVEAQQTTMQARLQQLEEDLKPENIEKSLAGVGSTKPEELRERRRRELEIQKNNVDFQLTRLAKSKARLETGMHRLMPTSITRVRESTQMEHLQRRLGKLLEIPQVRNRKPKAPHR